jgi:hypothetical protein
MAKKLCSISLGAFRRSPDSDYFNATGIPHARLDTMMQVKRQPTPIGSENLYIVLALVLAALTMIVARQPINATTITIGLFVALAYWRIGRGCAVVVYAFRVRLARLRTQSAKVPDDKKNV